LRLLLTAGLLMTTCLGAAAQQEFTATLTGHAVLPAKTFVAAPADAPAVLQTSGKFSGKTPVRITTEAGTGETLPIKGQPVQGFSGIKALGNGTYLVGSDNGFGSKLNSPDAMLMFHEVKPDFEKGTVDVLKTTFLSDPSKVVPFVISGEATDTRYLTGSDFDLEGFQPVGDKLYIGEEFGPYVISVDRATGKLLSFNETEANGGKVRSPDHFAVNVPNPDGKLPEINLKRSKGYEGFAAAPDGSKLYALAEGPMWNVEKAAYETVDGNEAASILEFDTASNAWTGRSWLFRFEANGHAIGDFNMIDATRGLIIERDNGEGDAELACKDGATTGCFKSPAKFKRVYLVDIAVEPGKPVRKIAYIDLMNIQDPKGVARLGKRADARFTFPFFTIENVDKVDDTTLIVANDNNFPFSKGRAVDAIDNNEFILLNVGDFLKAK
jgi:hypothetical protein